MAESLFRAAETGFVNRIQELIKSGADVNSKDKRGWQALHLAADGNFVEAMQMLIDAKADVNAQNLTGWTALRVAAVNGHIEASQLLLKSRANVSIADKDGRIPLHWAASNNKIDAMKLLVAARTDVNHRDHYGGPALHWAASRGFLDATKYLVEEAGANPFIPNRSEENAAFQAEKAGFVEVASFLKDFMSRHSEDDYKIIGGSNFRIQKKDLAQLDTRSLLKSAGGKAMMYSMLLLVGQGRAGKTGLRNALLGKSFEQTDSTLGMAQNMLQVVRDEVKIGSCASWSEFDRKNHKEHSEALARVLSENIIRTHSGDSKSSDPKLDPPIEEFLLSQFSDEIVSRTSSATTATMLPHHHNNDADDACYSVDHDLVLHYLEDDHTCHPENLEPLKMTLWDFGGQEVFYTMHHLFLKRFGVYLVAFNMEWLLPQADPSRVQKCLDMISFWLRSVKVHTQDADASAAPVFLVGTHKDIVADPKDHEHINKVLFEHFGHDFSNLVPFEKADVSTGRGNLWFYPVDNQKGSSGDRVIAELMATIEKTVREEEYTKRKVPFEWMAVCDKLQVDNRKSMTLTEFEDICRECGVRDRDSNWTAREEVQLMLRHMANLGMLMYHSENGLGDLVVTNPVEFLVGAASKVICDHEIHFVHEHKEAKKKMEAAWSKMTRYGIVSSDLLKLLWTGEEYRNHTEELERLMLKFGLIVPIVEEREGEGSQEYFVPALFNYKTSDHGSSSNNNDDDAAAVSQHSTDVCLTFYILFGPKTMAKLWQESGVISQSRVQKEGFLPHGILSRLVGKAISRSQMYCGEKMDLSSLSIRGKLASGLAFGDHEFCLLEMSLENMVRVDVFVDNLMVVMASLRSLAQQVVEECVPSLEAVVAAPVDGSDDTELQFLLIYGENGLHDRVSQGKEPHPCLSKTMKGSMTMETRFNKYLPPMGILPEYDVFISYRWGHFDSEFAEGLFYSLSRLNIGRSQTKVFLDKQRLPQGRDFVQEFMGAMLKTKVVVPIVSVNALKRMRGDGFDPSQRDNVLVEWVLALALEDLGKLSRIHPILLGDFNEVSLEMSNLFTQASVPLDQLSEQVPTAVVEQVRSFLGSQGLDKDLDFLQLSVKQVVKRLMDHLGTLGWDILNQNHTNTNHDIATAVAHQDQQQHHQDPTSMKTRLQRQCGRNVMKILKEQVSSVTLVESKVAAAETVPSEIEVQLRMQLQMLERALKEKEEENARLRSIISQHPTSSTCSIL